MHHFPPLLEHDYAQVSADVVASGLFDREIFVVFEAQSLEVSDVLLLRLALCIWFARNIILSLS
jgi:hypothetical protein